MSPTELFDRIQKTVRELVGTQYALWKNELMPELAKNGIYVREIAELSAKRIAWANRYFQQEVFPMLTPLAVDASHPFPHLLNRSHNLLVRAKTRRRGEPLTTEEQEVLGRWERLSTVRKAFAIGAFAVGTFGLGFTLGGLIFGRWRKA